MAVCVPECMSVRPVGTEVCDARSLELQIQTASCKPPRGCWELNLRSTAKAVPTALSLSTISPTQEYIYYSFVYFVAVGVVRSQKKLLGVIALLPPCGFQGLNSDCKAWWQAPFPTRLCFQP